MGLRSGPAVLKPRRRTRVERRNRAANAYARKALRGYRIFRAGLGMVWAHGTTASDVVGTREMVIASFGHEIGGEQPAVIASFSSAFADSESRR